MTYDVRKTLNIQAYESQMVAAGGVVRKKKKKGKGGDVVRDWTFCRENML